MSKAGTETFDGLLEITETALRTLIENARAERSMKPG